MVISGSGNMWGMESKGDMADEDAWNPGRSFVIFSGLSGPSIAASHSCRQDKDKSGCREDIQSSVGSGGLGSCGDPGGAVPGW